MVKLPLGHSYVQLPHCTQRKWSMDQVRPFLSTSMAPQGQRFTHKLHRMHVDSSTTTWPFKPAGGSFFTNGVQHGLGLFEQRPERHFAKFESAHRSTFPCS